MNLKTYTFLTFFLLFIASIQAAEIIVKDADLQGGGVYNWTKDNVYILDGNVFLEEGGVLNIEAGTVIKAKTVSSNGADLTSALIITRGAKINAVGTPSEPIIFTSEVDDISITTDLTADNSQLWGGLIILGKSIVGEDGGEDIIEGVPSTELRAKYGGNDPNDNSGILKYVSIRHGGSVLVGDNEINGLTLGGVGSGTTIDYIEVFASFDDGIEIFGGTVNITHAVVSFVGDDSYDFDESYDGFLQFIFSIQASSEGFGDNAIEYDGSEHTDGTPKTTGRIYNGTFIGSGAVNTSSDGLRLKEDGAVEIWNSIFTDLTGYFVRVEGTSITRLAAGDSGFVNNIVNGYGTYVQGDVSEVIAALAAGNTEKDVDPNLGGVSRISNNMLDPRLDAGSPALVGAAIPSDAGASIVEYRGAFNNQTNWALGWTALDSYGYFGDLVIMTGVEFAENELGLSMAAPMPNPASTEVTIAFELPTASEVNVYLYNLTGQLVKTVQLDRQLAGSNQLNLNLADLQTGTYVIALQSVSGTVTRKIVKVK